MTQPQRPLQPDRRHNPSEPPHWAQYALTAADGRLVVDVCLRCGAITVPEGQELHEVHHDRLDGISARLDAPVQPEPEPRPRGVWDGKHW